MCSGAGRSNNGALLPWLAELFVFACEKTTGWRSTNRGLFRNILLTGYMGH